MLLRNEVFTGALRPRVTRQTGSVDLGVCTAQSSYQRLRTTSTRCMVTSAPEACLHRVQRLLHRCTSGAEELSFF